MSGAARAAVLAVALLAAPCWAPAHAAESLDSGFMPKGGRALLLEFTAGAGAPRLKDIVSARHEESEWRALIDANKDAPRTERERATLASYLAVNMPLPPPLADRADLRAALPPDGRDLAWNECQSCHSLFTGYLTQSRDAQGWRSIFLSPFHRELKLNPVQREEFARYAARNMPMNADEVPQDLKF